MDTQVNWNLSVPQGRQAAGRQVAERQESSFFEKKEAKKLFSIQVRVARTAVSTPRIARRPRACEAIRLQSALRQKFLLPGARIGSGKVRQAEGSSSFFEKKEPKKLFPVQVRVARTAVSTRLIAPHLRRRASLHPGSFRKRSFRPQTARPRREPKPNGEKFFCFFFFKKRRLFPSRHVPSFPIPPVA
jgi:hypothetical protein